MMRFLSIFAALVLPGAVMAMGLLGESRPTDLRLQNASHLATPIVIERLEINGAKYIAHAEKASTSWADPRGGSTTLASLPWPSGRDKLVLIESAWVDVEAGDAFEASVELPWQDFDIDRTVNAQLGMVVVYGRNGEFKLVTGDDPNPETGHYNGREVYVVCAKRAPGPAMDYLGNADSVIGLKELLAIQNEPRAQSLADTQCSGERS